MMVSTLKRAARLAGLLLPLAFSAGVVSFAPTPVAAQAQEDTLQITFEGTSKAETSFEAAKEIQAKALAETSREQVSELIGDKRFNKNRQLIETNIVRQAAKFIPFVNSGTPSKQPDGSWNMSVEMRISLGSLRKMVLDAGLLNDADGPASILPMVAFTSRVKGVSIRWWLGEEKGEAHKFLSERERSFHEALFRELSSQGFYLIRPQGLSISPLPETLRTERPSAAMLKTIGEYYRAPMVMKGDVRIRESREVSGAFGVSVRLQVVQAAGGRAIAEVVRNYETEIGAMEAVVRARLEAETPELAKDLAVQVLEAWQRGTLHTNLVRVAVRGRFSPKQIQDFKTGFMKNVRDVKSLKERIFEPGQIVFEADLAGQATELASAVKSLEIPGFHVKLASATDQGLVLDVTSR